MNLGVVDNYLFQFATSVSAGYHTVTVGLGLAVSLCNNLKLAPECVSLGINGGFFGIVVITVDTLEDSNAGFAAGSSYKRGVIEGVLFALVLVVILATLALAFYEVVFMRSKLAALTLTVYEVVLVRRNIVRIGLATLTYTVNEGVSMGNEIGIAGAASGACAVNKVVCYHLCFIGNKGFLTMLTGISAITLSSTSGCCFYSSVLVLTNFIFLIQILIQQGAARHNEQSENEHHYNRECAFHRFFSFVLYIVFCETYLTRLTDKAQTPTHVRIRIIYRLYLYFSILLTLFQYSSIILFTHTLFLLNMYYANTSKVPLSALIIGYFLYTKYPEKQKERMQPLHSLCLCILFFSDFKLPSGYITVM